MDNKSFAIGVIFEVAIGALGLVIAWQISDKNLLANLFAPDVLFNLILGIICGVCAAILVVIFARKFRIIQRSRSAKMLFVIRSFTWTQAIVLSLAAGICEELLFRGALQPLISIWFTSIIFAGLHAYGKLYFVTSFLASLGLGYLFIISNHLVAAIAAHAVYDLLIIAAIKGGILPVTGFISFRTKPDDENEDQLTE